MTENRSPVSRIVGAVVPMAVDSIDVDDLIARLDVDALMERVDVDALLTRIDIDALLGRIDIEGLLARIDVGALIGRVDINELIGQVDLNTVLDGVDIKAIVAKAGIDEIVAEASTGILARSLDLARRQLVGLDLVIMGIIDRILGRGRAALPAPDSSATGRPAGPISRLLAFSADLFLVSAIFSVVVYFGTAMVELFTGNNVQPTRGAGPFWAIAYFGWFFVYLWASVEIAGRTPGKALVGLRVVGLRGQPLGPGRAFVRTAVFPFSFILGLGFIPAIVRRDRRALHELVAGCEEIVDWGDRDAALPSALQGWVDRQRAAEQAGATQPGGPDAVVEVPRAPVDGPAAADVEPDLAADAVVDGSGADDPVDSGVASSEAEAEADVDAPAGIDASAGVPAPEAPADAELDAELDLEPEALRPAGASVVSHLGGGDGEAGAKADAASSEVDE